MQSESNEIRWKKNEKSKVKWLLKLTKTHFVKIIVVFKSRIGVYLFLIQ